MSALSAALPRRRGLAGPVAWLGAVLLAERARWPLWLPVAFGLGIGTYFALPVEPPWQPAAASLALIALLGWWLRQRPAALIVALVAGCCALGFAAAQWRTVQVAAPVLAKRIGPVTVGGRVLAVEPQPNGVRVWLDQVAVAGLAADATPRQVRVKLAARHGVPALGARVSLRAILLPPPPPAAPGSFDFQRHAYFQGLGGVGFALGTPEVDAGDDAALAPATLALRLNAVRQAVTRRVRAALPGDPGAIAAALLTGERGAISPAVLDAVRDAGLAHLLAISGLHVGLVTGLLFLVVRALLALVEPLALRWPIKKWAAAVALLGAFGYLLLAGATVPTQRAFLMTGLILLAVMLDRVAITLGLVAWAAVAVLLVAPESLLGPSFQMSFAAVVALVSVYEAARGPFGRWRSQASWPRRLLLYAGGVGLTTVVAAAATAPFVVYHFNRLATYGLAANLLAVPLTALWIMPCGVLALLLMPLGLEALALQPMGWGIEALIAIAETAAGWPGAVRMVAAMPAPALVAIALGGLWLCLWSRPWRWLGLVGIAAGLLGSVLARPPDVLVSETGKLLAVRDTSGALLLSSTRAEKFTAGIWLRRNGSIVPQPWPASGATSADGRLTCDAVGCVLQADGPLVALVRDGRALAEDCRRAALIVATVPVRQPCGAAVIDRFDLWRDGAHAVWLTPGGVRTLSVDAWRGARPWVPRR